MWVLRRKSHRCQPQRFIVGALVTRASLGSCMCIPQLDAGGWGAGAAATITCCRGTHPWVHRAHPSANPPLTAKAKGKGWANPTQNPAARPPLPLPAARKKHLRPHPGPGPPPPARRRTRTRRACNTQGEKPREKPEIRQQSAIDH
eukprot:scaffold1277_cov157-Isochrysis_galbana.AAC.2